MLQVYSNFHLVWAAKTAQVPVQMAVADFGSQRGLIAMISGGLWQWCSIYFLIHVYNNA
jgi:hypothetical protein